MQTETERDQTDLEAFEAFIARRAHAAVVYPERWIYGHDGDGLSYCYACAVKELVALRKERPWELPVDECDDLGPIDGGFSRDFGSPLFCDTCGAALDFDFTSDGAKEEIQGWLEWGENYGWRSRFPPQDCFCLANAIAVIGREHAPLGRLAAHMIKANPQIIMGRYRDMWE